MTLLIRARTMTLAAGVVLLGATPALAQAPARTPVLTTIGSARLSLAPTRMVINLVADSRSASAATAVQSNNHTLDALLPALRSQQGVDSLRVASVAVSPIEDDNSRILEYGAHATLDVFLHDLKRIGEILDVAFQRGATALGRMTFYSDSVPAVRGQLLQDAFKAARQDADALAAASGSRICRMVSMYSGLRNPMDRVSGFEEASVSFGYISSGYVPFSPMPSEVVTGVNVTVEWELCS